MVIGNIFIDLHGTSQAWVGLLSVMCQETFPKRHKHMLVLPTVTWSDGCKIALFGVTVPLLCVAECRGVKGNFCVLSNQSRTVNS